MPAIDSIGTRIAASITTLTAVTVNTDDSLSVRHAAEDAPISLYQVYVRQTSTGTFSIRSARMHDVSEGLRLRYQADGDGGVFPMPFEQRLFSQDVLTMEAEGTAAAEAGAFCLELYYQSIGGITQRLASWEEIAGRIEHYYGKEEAHTTSATAGQWPAGTAINATLDRFKVDRDYAWLGLEIDVAINVITLRGSESGNLRIPCPATNAKVETRDYHIRRGAAHQTPSIFVFNSANRGNVFVAGQDDAASTAVNVSLILALLA